VLDFFDFFLIAFIMAEVGPSWHLTYGQVTLIFYGSGIGAILGSLVWGSLGEVFGRQLQTVTGTLICGVSAGLIGFLPTGAYLPLALLRILVGFGLAAAITPALTIVVELTPTRWRTGITSLFVLTASLGPLLASASAAVLLQRLGWRGVAMLGFAPILIGAAVWLLVPESVRWLTAKGRFAEARAEAAKHLGNGTRQCALAGDTACNLAAREPRRTLYDAPPVLADDSRLGWLDDGSFWVSSVGPDDRCAGSRYAGGARPRNTLSMSPPARSSDECLRH